MKMCIKMSFHNSEIISPVIQYDLKATCIAFGTLC